MVDGEEAPAAPARGVLARIERPGAPWIVVSTPQSGWFACGGERGPGVALLLGLARRAAARPGRASWLFASATGHELGGVGLEALLAAEAPPPEAVRAWAHLGAGLATFAWERDARGRERRAEQAEPRRVLMAHPELVPALEAPFAGLAGLAPRSDVPKGGTRRVLESGYRAFGLAGAHRLRHTPVDGPESTAPELLEPVAGAMAAVLGALAGAGRPLARGPA